MITRTRKGEIAACVDEMFCKFEARLRADGDPDVIYGEVMTFLKNNVECINVVGSFGMTRKLMSHPRLNRVILTYVMLGV